MKSIQENAEVLTWWDTLAKCEQASPENSSTLFHQIIEQYITIRGFSFTARWIERYKSSQQKNLQKSKGLRKKLCS